MIQFDSNEHLQLINEFYSKCLKQKHDISDGINKIVKGDRKISEIEEMNDQVREKLENYEESLRMIEKVLSELTVSRDKEIWKK
jgi:hypothetical protein